MKDSPVSAPTVCTLCGSRTCDANQEIARYRKRIESAHPDHRINLRRLRLQPETERVLVSLLDKASSSALPELRVAATVYSVTSTIGPERASMIAGVFKESERSLRALTKNARVLLTEIDRLPRSGVHLLKQILEQREALTLAGVVGSLEAFQRSCDFVTSYSRRKPGRPVDSPRRDLELHVAFILAHCDVNITKIARRPACKSVDRDVRGNPRLASRGSAPSD